MSHSLRQAIMTVKPHIPLIRFRKGTPNVEQGKQAKTGPTKLSASSIDESLLPPKYHRKPVSGQEIEFIERGGPDIIS